MSRGAEGGGGDCCTLKVIFYSHSNTPLPLFQHSLTAAAFDYGALAGAIVEGIRIAFPILSRSSSTVSTGAHTPAEPAEGSSAALHHFQPVQRVEETVYAVYSLSMGQVAKLAKNSYYSQMKERVVARNVTERYSISQSRAHINIRDGKELIFQCSLLGVAPRNLLLELHGSDYDIPTWLLKRARGDFDNFGYVSTSSP